METIIGEFNKITCNAELDQFVEKYKLRSDDKRNEIANTNRKSEYNYIGKFNELNLEIQHTWWDRSRTFDPRPDGNSVNITILNSLGETVGTSRVGYHED